MHHHQFVQVLQIIGAVEPDELSDELRGLYDDSVEDARRCQQVCTITYVHVKLLHVPCHTVMLGPSNVGRCRDARDVHNLTNTFGLSPDTGKAIHATPL